MKFKKETNRLCPHCKKHTPHKVSNQKNKAKGATHPQSAGSKSRAKKRGEWRGHGNLGKYSKPPKPKMSGKKSSKKTDLRYECKECGKKHMQKSGLRAKKIEFI